MLDALAAADARATFFCTGKAAAEHPDLVRRAAGEGHEIGTHLWSHARTTVDHDHAFATELESSRQLLAELTGQPVRWLRFPYGRAGRQHQRRLPAPVEAVHWTVSSHDSRLSDPAAIIARVVAALRPGAIVLLHDGIADEHEGPVRPPYQPTRDAGVAALPTLLTSLTMRGYAPVTLSGLWADASRAAAA